MFIAEPPKDYNIVHPKVKDEPSGETNRTKHKKIISPTKNNENLGDKKQAETPPVKNEKTNHSKEDEDKRLMKLFDDFTCEHIGVLYPKEREDPASVHNLKQEPFTTIVTVITRQEFTKKDFAKVKKEKISTEDSAVPKCRDTEDKSLLPSARRSVCMAMNLLKEKKEDGIDVDIRWPRQEKVIPKPLSSEDAEKRRRYEQRFARREFSGPRRGNRRGGRGGRRGRGRGRGRGGGRKRKDRYNSYDDRRDRKRSRGNRDGYGDSDVEDNYGRSSRGSNKGGGMSYFSDDDDFMPRSSKKSKATEIEYF